MPLVRLFSVHQPLFHDGGMTNFKKFHLLQHLQVIGTRHSDANLNDVIRHVVKEMGRRVLLAHSVRELEQVHVTLRSNVFLSASHVNDFMFISWSFQFLAFLVQFIRV